MSIIIHLTRDILFSVLVDIFCKYLFSILSRLYTLYKLYNSANIQTLIFFRQYNIAKNIYQQKYSSLKSKIVKNIELNNMRLEKKMCKKNLNKIYNIVYISNNKKKRSYSICMQQQYISVLQTCFLTYKPQININRVLKKKF